MKIFMENLITLYLDWLMDLALGEHLSTIKTESTNWAQHLTETASWSWSCHWQLSTNKRIDENGCCIYCQHCHMLCNCLWFEIKIILLYVIYNLHVQWNLKLNHNAVSCPCCNCEAYSQHREDLIKVDSFMNKWWINLGRFQKTSVYWLSVIFSDYILYLIVYIIAQNGICSWAVRNIVL